MPEGHTVHRIALQMAADLVGRRIAVSSPQGRFAAGAALLDGRTMTDALAVGKQMFLRFQDAAAGTDDGTERWLRVHLGLYGAWDLRGRISPLGAGGVVSSIGAPRAGLVAVRVGEGERPLPGGADLATDDDAMADAAEWVPPEPVGQVRVRLLTDHCLADLRGPIACEVLSTEEVAVVIAKAGPDPRIDAGPDAEQAFVERLTTRGSPVGLLLMDQGVVSGIGNVYRAEMLFRARLDPHTPGKRVPTDVARALWRDWAELLEDGVRTGAMVTREGLDREGRARALAEPTERHAVYHRTGDPCLVCGTPVRVEAMGGRNLYWCGVCQV